MKQKLIHITCTGIDRSTDLDALVALQREVPIAEFGVLVSAKEQDSPRYPGMAFIRSLRSRELNLALHLCGRLAREAASGNWAPTEELLGKELGLFRRIQLNIGGYERRDLPEHLAITIPDGIDEVIIQQRDAGSCGLFLDAAWREPRLSVLLDASGGRGIRGGDVKGVGHIYKTGFAGGLGEDTAEDVMRAILRDGDVGAFWVDAESRLRDDDHFSVRKARRFILATITEYRRFSGNNI